MQFKAGPRRIGLVAENFVPLSVPAFLPLTNLPCNAFAQCDFFPSSLVRPLPLRLLLPLLSFHQSFIAFQGGLGFLNPKVGLLSFSDVFPPKPNV